MIASGTPDELKATIGNRLDVVVHDAATLTSAAGVLARATGAEPVLDTAERMVSVAVNRRCRLPHRDRP